MYLYDTGRRSPRQRGVLVLQPEIENNAQDDELLGRVVNLPKRDMVLIRSRSVDELRADLAGQVDFYEETLRRHGRAPAPVG